MKRFISRRSFLKTAGVTTAAAAVAVGAPSASACFGKGKLPEITILYTNDVHTYIDHKSPELTYASIAALKKSYEEQGKNVLLVDAGDHIQGTAYGSMDDGATIIRLMNEAGYDLATPGNHEFDYGMDRAKMVSRKRIFRTFPATGSTCAAVCGSCPASSFSISRVSLWPLWALPHRKPLPSPLRPTS